MDTVKAFCNTLAKTIDTHPCPERTPLREVGYTNHAIRRFKGHRTHQSSNYLMNLIQSTCEVIFPGRFFLDQYVVALLTSATAASIGEIIITELVQGYVSSGLGMSFALVGRSNRSARHFTSEKIAHFQ